MNKTQILLTILMEECNETAQRASKCIRFGMDEVQEGQELNNTQRLLYEFNDIVGTLQHVMYYLKDDRDIIDPEYISLKRDKIEKWLLYSAKMGMFKDDNRAKALLYTEVEGGKMKLLCDYRPIYLEEFDPIEFAITERDVYSDALMQKYKTKQFRINECNVFCLFFSDGSVFETGRGWRWHRDNEIDRINSKQHILKVYNEKKNEETKS